MNIHIRSKFDQLDKFIPLSEKYNTGIELALSFDDILDVNKFTCISGLPLSIHAPFFDVNIASYNRYVMEKSVEIMIKTIEICNLLNVKNVVFHHNYSPFMYNFDEDGYTERFCENFEKVLLYRMGDFTISFENVFETNSSIGDKIIKMLNRDFVGYCFDIGHFNLFTEITLQEWLNSWKGKIYEYHLHNNYGYRDDHNRLDYGNINIKDLLMIQKVSICTIENRNVEDTEASINYLKSLCL